MTSIGKGSCRATGREPRDTRSPIRPASSSVADAKAKEPKAFSSALVPFRSPPSSPSLADALSTVSTVSTGESASAMASTGFACEAIGRTSSSAICNPRRLILRGNDNLGTIHRRFSRSLSFLTTPIVVDIRPQLTSRILLATFS